MARYSMEATCPSRNLSVLGRGSIHTRLHWLLVERMECFLCSSSHSNSCFSLKSWANCANVPVSDIDEHNVHRGTSFNQPFFFITFGVSLSTSHAKVEEEYTTLIIQLRHLSEIWKPNDPHTVDNNRHLFDIPQRILAGAGKTLHTLQIMAIGWAITAITIITFYIVNAIWVGKVTQRTLRMATGRATFLTYAAKDTKSISQFHRSGCDDELELKAESNHPQVSQPSQPSGMMRSASCLSLQRKLYLLRASCGFMVISLGFNFCISIMFVMKARLLLVETYWQITIVSYSTISCILLSFSLFVQSLMQYIQLQ